MDHETLFTASKWEILEQIENTEKSPIEIAKQISTSVANISQQLRLLEMAGLVKSRRVPNRDKGQPRILYRLNKSTAFVICTSPNFVKKKEFHLNNFRRATLRAWFYEKESHRKFLEKFLWQIEEHIDGIEEIYIDAKDSKNLSVKIINNNNGKKFSLTNISASGNSIQIKLQFSNKLDSGDVKNHYLLYSTKNQQSRGD